MHPHRTSCWCAAPEREVDLLCALQYKDREDIDDLRALQVGGDQARRVPLGSIVEFEGRWYVFYHRSTHASKMMRKACVEHITFEPDGSIPEVEMTTQGVAGPLPAQAKMDAERACLLYGNVRIEAFAKDNEQLGGLRNGDAAAYKYIEFIGDEKTFNVRVAPGSSPTRIEVKVGSPWSATIATVDVPGDGYGQKWRMVTGEVAKPTTGVHAVWLRFGTGEGDDLARVDHVRSAFPDMPIGVDANGSYRWEDRNSLLAMDGLGVAYIEQPFPADDLTSHADLRDEIVAPVALDEPIDSEVSAIRVIEAAACDLLVVKPARVGMTAARSIHDLALAAGLRIKASGLLETEIGRVFTLAVATLPAAIFSDVAEASWFLEGSIVGADASPSTGDLTPSNGSGIGFDPNPAAFDSYVVAESVLGSRIWD